MNIKMRGVQIYENNNNNKRWINQKKHIRWQKECSFYWLLILTEIIERNQNIYLPYNFSL